jgi:AraC-like DNA-binding protein
MPLFYLYLLAITTPGFLFNRSHLWHLLVSGIILIGNIPYLITPNTEKLVYLSKGFNSGIHSGMIPYLTSIYVIGIFVILPLQLIYYFWRALTLYRRHRTYIQDHYSFTENISLHWILALMASLVLFFLSNQMLYLIGFDRSIFSSMIYNVLMLGITLFSGYYALSQMDLKAVEEMPEYQAGLMESTDIAIESGTYQARSESFHAQDTENTTLPESETTKLNLSRVNKLPVSARYAGSPLSESRKILLINRLDNIMKQEKIFKIESLSVEDVANRLETNTKYVSQVINEQYGRNFYNYINAYRVEEAQKLLLSGGWERYSMTGIAQMVGFGSKSSFNSSFKRITGLTPSEFIKSEFHSA